MSANFNPKDVTVLLGIFPVLGMTEDEDAIQVNMTAEGDSIVAGLHDACRVQNPQRHGTAVIRLMATGLGRNSHAAFLAHYNRGNPLLPFAVVSKDTGEIIASATASLQRYPGVGLGLGAPTREWTLNLMDIFMQATPDVGAALSLI